MSENPSLSERASDGARVRYAAEVAGAASIAGLAAVVLMGVGFLSETGSLAAVAATTRLWLAVALLVPCLVLWLLGRRWRAVFFAAVALAGFASTLGPAFRQTSDGDVIASLDVIEFNVLTENAGGEEVAAALVAANADLVFLMEAESLSPYMQRLQQTYPYAVGCGKPTERCDLVLLSKRPLLAPQWHSLSRLSPNRTITAQIDVGKLSVTVTAAHLIKPYYDNFAAAELVQLRAMLRKQPMPRILAGDFNAASWSPDVAEMLKRGKLQSAWPEPPTWPVRLGSLGIPIDHIFSSTGLTRIRNLRSFGEGLGSNHLGLRATIDIFRPRS